MLTKKHDPKSLVTQVKDHNRSEKRGRLKDEPTPGEYSNEYRPLEVVNNGTAARVLGVAPKTLNNWRTLGIGPPHLKYGGRHGPVRYLLSDLVAWQQSHRRTGRS